MAKIVPFTREACPHEGGEHADHCSRCAPFWARYPVATSADDVGRMLWIVEGGSLAKARGFAFSQGAHAYARRYGRTTVHGPIVLRAPSVAHLPVPGSKDPIARCGARPGTIASAWASTPERASETDRRMCDRCLQVST